MPLHHFLPITVTNAALTAPGAPGAAKADDKNYIGLDLLQEQTRKKALRQGFVFNLMVAGRSGLGKSTLVNTLFKSEVTQRRPDDQDAIPSTTEICSVTNDLNENGVKLSLTITDTPGFGDQINNENCWEPIVQYIEDQYSEYLDQEQKPDRPVHIPDSRVHCCLYFIQPTGHALSSLDIEVLQRLAKIVNVVPVIAKADTLTPEEKQCFKERIRADLLDHKINIYPAVDFEGNEEDQILNSKMKETIPFAVIGSTTAYEVHGRKVFGRKTNWGLAEVENKNHNDFAILRDLLIRTHMTDLVDTTAVIFYESFRREKLINCKEDDAEEAETQQTNDV